MFKNLLFQHRKIFSGFIGIAMQKQFLRVLTTFRFNYLTYCILVDSSTVIC